MFSFVAAGRFSDAMTRTILKQLLKVIHFAHNKGISHLDVKPENILVDKHGTLKLCDFGLMAPICGD